LWLNLLRFQKHWPVSPSSAAVWEVPTWGITLQARDFLLFGILWTALKPSVLSRVPLQKMENCGPVKGSESPQAATGPAAKSAHSQVSVKTAFLATEVNMRRRSGTSVKIS
jgi:hypothetical protein